MLAVNSKPGARELAIALIQQRDSLEMTVQASVAQGRETVLVLVVARIDVELALVIV
jgi:hypothetical protein